jgi:hypothetical protein
MKKNDSFGQKRRKSFVQGFLYSVDAPIVVAYGMVTEGVGENTFAAIKWWNREDHGPYLSRNQVLSVHSE